MQLRRHLARSALALFTLSLFTLHPFNLPAPAAPAAPPLPFPKLFDTQATNNQPLTPPLDALKLLKLPPGFQATLFAAEPDVQNPIAMAWDSRGRLWIAENYTYAESKVGFDRSVRDRILIFEDNDNDGRFDKRTVFWDGAQLLTSIELGFGGVFALCPPNLLFLPDRNGDDVPDSEPIVLLDGFETDRIRHNIANGLKWGPDGWLYARHGITSTSTVGKPGAPEAERTKMNCGIWRYHPVRKIFEPVAHGTTNPWGMDWNEHGEAFFINTVIGHLWHVIPGAHYRRMFGEALDPHAYGFLEQHADHFHWDTREKWSDIRAKGVTDTTSLAGGGHAHSGLMIYQGDNWPDEYRGAVFTVNLHGHRVNMDRLERRGSGYVGKHAPDFLTTTDPWFRGLDLTYGPDGGVFLIDWADIGECHDNDGVHRTSGRIYKITYGQPKPPQVGEIARLRERNLPENQPREAAWVREPSGDLAKLNNIELVKLQLHKNEWYARQSRQLLQQRAAANRLLAPDTAAQLRQLFATSTNLTHQLRAFWTLHSIGAADETWLRGCLKHDSEYVRASAIRSLFDHQPARLPGELMTPAKIDPQTAGELARVARFDPSSRAALALASALPRMPMSATAPTIIGLKEPLAFGLPFTGRAPFAVTNLEPLLSSAEHLATIPGRLMARPDFAEDQNLPLLVWLGTKDLVETGLPIIRAPALWSYSPLVRRFFARRLAEAIDRNPTPIDSLLSDITSFGRLATWPSNIARPYDTAIDVLEGLADGLRGRRKAPSPSAWKEFQETFTSFPFPRLTDRLRDLSILFGDGRALDDIRRIALDGSVELTGRRAALQTLLDQRAPDLRKVCEQLLGVRELAGIAARGLGLTDDPAIGELLAKRYSGLYSSARPDVIATLVSRPSFAKALLAHVGPDAKQIPRADISAFHARQIRSFNDPALTAKLTEVWGVLRDSAADKQQLIAKWKTRLTPAVIASGNASQGRAIFNVACAACHRLYGDGGAIGPELTGAGRDNLDYLLENIADPSALVPADYLMSVINLKDGRTLNAVIGARTDRTLTLQTMTEKLTLERADVKSIEESKLSLMPEGLLEALSETQVRDLIAYLMSRQPVALPAK